MVVTPNDHLFKMFMKLRIPTVSDYKPRSIPDAKWVTGTLVPTFTSFHNYLTSEWCGQYYLNEETGPLGEGMVVVSALNGELYKVKHGGEKSGLMPERLAEAIQILKEFPALEKVLDVLLAL